MKNTDPPLSPAESLRYYKLKVPKLHKSGSELRAPCPIHHGKRDSFSVNPQTGAWFCHSGCQRGGGAFDFEAAVSGVDFKHAHEEVLRIVGRTHSSNGTAKRAAAEYNYVDEKGKVLFQCVRYVPKDFRQRRPNGHGGWIWNLEGVRLVLYRLPAVMASPSVLVAEGEKDAEALSALGFTATCNPMGAGKWRGEYAEMLRAKEVFVIPDADEPGRKHAAAVLRSLKGIARSVKLLPLPGAKDASEWIERGGTREALTQLVEQSAPGKVGPGQDSNGHAAAAGAPSVERNPHFTVKDSGVFHQDGTLVCSPLLVTAYARNGDSQCWGRLLEWQDDDGRPHSWNMPMEMLAGEGAELRGVLLGGGVTINHKARNLLPWYIQSERPARRVIAAEHLGWHNRTFVFPDSSIPEDASEPVLYQSPGRTQHFYHVRGSLEEWRVAIGRRCAANSRLVFSVSCAFAGPLLRPLGAEGGGFHLNGISSSGKTTTQWVAGSVCGGGLDGQSFKRTWRSTQNALEATAEMHNDGLLLLDEMREVGDARELDSTIYMLSNGAGRGRMTKAITLRRPLSWRLLFLSTGEVTLNEHVATAGGKTKGGAAVRLLNIPADAKAGLGAFECLHAAESPRVFAEELRDAATRTFGSPLREFIRRFSLDWDNELEQAKRDVAEFVRKFCPPGAAAEVGRGLGRFALVAAAGEMATRFGITGWKPSEARRAALRCFQDWVEDRGGVGQADVEAGVRQVRAFIAAKGSSRFQSVVQEFDPRGNELRERIHERAGFWKEEDGERFYLIFTDVFTDEVCSGFNSQMVLEELERRNLLVKGDGRNLAKRETVPHEGRLRFYVIRAAILGT